MTHTTEQLEPCPFCGGADLRVYKGHHNGYAECKTCGTYGPDAKNGDWNTRAPSAELIAALKRIAELEAGLTFYAESHSQNPNDGPWGMSSTDYGTRARAALGDAQ